jgi:hypothetical protein
MDLKPLVRCLGQGIDHIQHALKDHRIAYGHYSIRELRKAIQDGQPVIIDYGQKNATALVIGENPNSMILTDSRGQVREVPDEELVQSWSGRAVLVQGEIKGASQEKDLVIFTPERDNWPAECREAQDAAVRVLRPLRLGSFWLPNHPVILAFRKPTQHEIKNVIRSMTVGPEIVIYDPSDPVSEFFHELGHIFWSNRLTNDERNAIKDHHATLTKDTISPLFMTEAHWKTDQEYFATIYMWYAKGQVMHRGYLTLLEQMDPAGMRIITGIISRLQEQAAQRRTWEKAAPLLRAFVDAMEDGKRYRLPNRMIKARFPVKVNPGTPAFPAAVVDHEILKTLGAVQFVKVTAGILAGAVLPVEGGLVNTPLAKAIYQYYQPLSKAIPGRKDLARLHKKQIINIKGHPQTVYVREDKKDDYLENRVPREVGVGINMAYKKEWQTKGRLSLMGQTVKSTNDLAYLSQVYRNPQYETLRVFFVNDQNTIVGHTGVSCRLPGTATTLVDPGNMTSTVQFMKETMKSCGASKWYFVHNHPSGEVKPSKDDLKTTAYYHTEVPGFQGHVIINHNKYCEIRQKSNVILSKEHEITGKDEADRYLTPSIPHDALGKTVHSPFDLIELVKAYALHQESYVTFIGVANKVRAIAQVPREYFLGTGTRGLKYARQFALDMGTQSLFAVGLDMEKHGKAIKKGMAKNYFVDVILDDQRSVRTERLAPQGPENLAHGIDTRTMKPVVTTRPRAKGVIKEILGKAARVIKWKGFKSIKPMSVAQFTAWIRSGDTTRAA